jgi:hypothetical protein
MIYKVGANYTPILTKEIEMGVNQLAIVKTG